MSKSKKPFEVYLLTHSHGVFFKRYRRYDTFTAAEAYARYAVVRWRCDPEISGPDGELAIVKIDAYDRIWTDLTPTGATLV